MDSNALEASLGAGAAPRSPMQVLLDIEGPDSTFQQDATDYFCYAQLASQVSLCFTGIRQGGANVLLLPVLALCVP